MNCCFKREDHHYLGRRSDTVLPMYKKPDPTGTDVAVKTVRSAGMAFGTVAKLALSGAVCSVVPSAYFRASTQRIFEVGALVGGLVAISGLLANVINGVAAKNTSAKLNNMVEAVISGAALLGTVVTIEKLALMPNQLQPGEATIFFAIGCAASILPKVSSAVARTVLGKND